MAPKKPKPPSMLQRQRALRNQQQKNKQQSSRQLPPGKKGGPAVKTNPTTQKPAQPNPVEQVRVRDLGSAKPQQLPSGTQRALPAGRAGGALSRVGEAANSTAKNLTKTGGRLSGLKGGLIAGALYDAGSRAIDAYASGLKNAIRTERGQRAAESGQSGRYIPGNQQSRGGMGGVGNIPRSEGPLNNPNYGKPATPQRTQPAVSRSTSNSSGSSRPSQPSTPPPRRIPSPASDAGMKNQDKNYRGNLFEKTFGYKTGNAPDQQQARTSNLSNKFGQDSGYQPQTKVDGSQYADKKPDMAKVKEYDRRKRRYYS